MSDLIAGDPVDFAVDGQTLTVEALPYGNIKQIMRMVFSIGKDIQTGHLTEMTDLVDKYLGEGLPLLFKKDRYPFLTREWAESHLTVPVLRKIVETAIVVNGLDDFFVKAGLMARVRKAPPNETPTTPSAKDGSTTSSGSPTDGVPKTLTS